MTNCSEMPFNLFSFTQFRKNTSANPLVSHSFKTKDLKPFRFTHFQKKGGGTPRHGRHEQVGDSASPRQPRTTNHESLVTSDSRESRLLSGRITASESFCRPRTYIGNV